MERRRLFGAGIGVEAHLLAAVLVTGTRLWALDAPLARAAQQAPDRKSLISSDMSRRAGRGAIALAGSHLRSILEPTQML